LARVLSAVSFVGALSAAQQPPAFRARVDLVQIGVTVTDRKGNLVTDLTPADVEIVEDGRVQAIRFFAAGDGSAGQRPALHLGLLLDVSESMGEDIRFTKTAAIKFVSAIAQPPNRECRACSATPPRESRSSCSSWTRLASWIQMIQVWPSARSFRERSTSNTKRWISNGLPQAALDPV